MPKYMHNIFKICIMIFRNEHTTVKTLKTVVILSARGEGTDHSASTSGAIIGTCAVRI